MDPDGAVALVTGASRGVGAATALELARRGASVACAARATDAQPVPLPGTLDETVRAIEAEGGRAVAVPTDLSFGDEVARMIAATEERLGPIDVLVNNAAITFPGDLELETKRFDLMMAVDLRAPVLAAKAVVPGMRARGRGVVVNVSSAAATGYFPGLMAYGMAKTALEFFSLALSEQLRDEPVDSVLYRIDEAVASEGFSAAMADVDQSDWLPTAVPAGHIADLVTAPRPSATLAELRSRASA